MIEYKICGIKKVGNGSYGELSLYTISDVDHSIRTNTVLVKADKLSSYHIGEYLQCYYRKFGDKWYLHPVRYSTKNPLSEVFVTVSPDELPF